jgi:hypothetical protein
VEQYSKIEVLPKVFVNGELTLTENTGMQQLRPKKGHRPLPIYITHHGPRFFGRSFLLELHALSTWESLEALCMGSANETATVFAQALSVSEIEAPLNGKCRPCS